MVVVGQTGDEERRLAGRMAEMSRFGIFQFSRISRKSTGKGDGVEGVWGWRWRGGEVGIVGLNVL